MSVFMITPGAIWADISDIIAGIRDLGDLLLADGGGDVAILCLDEWRLSPSPFTRGASFRNFKRDVHCDRRPQQNIHRPALSSKAVMRHRQRVSRGREEEESVHSLLDRFSLIESSPWRCP